MRYIIKLFICYLSFFFKLCVGMSICVYVCVCLTPTPLVLFGGQWLMYALTAINVELH